MPRWNSCRTPFRHRRGLPPPEGERRSRHAGGDGRRSYLALRTEGKDKDPGQPSKSRTRQHLPSTVRGRQLRGSGKKSVGRLPIPASEGRIHRLLGINKYSPSFEDAAFASKRTSAYHQASSRRVAIGTLIKELAVRGCNPTTSKESFRELSKIRETTALRKRQPAMVEKIKRRRQPERSSQVRG